MWEPTPPQTPSALILPSCFPGPWLDHFRAHYVLSLSHTLTHIQSQQPRYSHKPSHSYTLKTHIHSCTHSHIQRSSHLYTLTIHTLSHTHICSHTQGTPINTCIRTHICSPSYTLTHSIIPSLPFSSSHSISHPTASLSTAHPFPITASQIPLPCPFLPMSHSSGLSG